MTNPSAPRKRNSGEMQLHSLREARRFASQPLAIRHQWFQEFQAALRGDDRTTLQALRFGWGSAVQAMETVNGVGILEIRGPMVQGYSFKDYSDIRFALDEFAGAAGVHAILLDLDTPGGDVHAELFNLCERIREVRQEKAVWALASGQAASAGYLLAAQAQKIYVASAHSTIVGSLGVIAVHLDFSGMNEQMGLRITEIVTGRHKNELSRDRPLGKDGRATIQMIVDGAFQEMLDSITAGRKALTEEGIREQEAAIYLAAEAQERSLIDGVALRADLVERLAKKTPASVFALNGGVMKPSGEIPDSNHQSTDREAAPAPAPDPNADPNPGSSPGAGAAVIDLASERTRIRGEEQAVARALAVAVVESCQLAGMPALAATLLAEEGMTRELAVQRIQEARIRAGGPEIHSESDVTAMGAAAQPKIDRKAIYERLNRRGKE